MQSKEFFARLGRAIYHIDGFYDEFAKRSKVKENLLWILYALNDGQPHSQKDISEDWSLARTTINTIIKELKQKGFVEFAPIKGERRELTVILTPSGKAFADEVLQDLYAYERKLFQQLNIDHENLIHDLEVVSQKYQEIK